MYRCTATGPCVVEVGDSFEVTALGRTDEFCRNPFTVMGGDCSFHQCAYVEVHDR